MLDKRSYDRRGPVRAVAAVLGTALVIAMLIFAQAQSAQAVTHLYLIDSLSAVGSDTDVGDGVCMTAAGTCTLRAALEQANALPPGDTVTIAPAEDVDASTPGVQDSGTIVGSGSGAANFMFVGNLTPLGDGGAYFMATRPLMVDFQNRLGIASLNDANGATAVFVNGPGVTLRNFSNIRSNETAMVVGAAGAGALIEDGSCTDPGSINLERCLWLADGAHGVTVRNVQMGSTWSGGGSAVRLAVGAMVNNLTLDRVRFYDPDNEAYDGFQGQSWGHLDNLTVIGSTFEGFRSGRNALDFRNLILTNAQITGNTFIRNNSGATPSIAINRSGTENLIAGNVFANSAAENTSNAIAFSGMAVAAAVESGWQVRDNSFDGYRAASVTMASGSGILPVFHNLFGPLSFGGSAPANETNAAALVNNGTATANQGIVTWFPSAVSTDPLTCTLTVDVSPPVTTPTPEIPVRVDVYYTAASQAEVFLGSQSGLTTASPITVPYTIGEGFIRVQTQAANGSTSQYSRTIAQTEPDSCAPTVTVEQAVTQTDPTSIRSLSFTAQFSESIPGGLDPAVVSTAGSTAPGVHVTDVTPVSDRVFRITAQADASGLIVVSLPEGAAMDAAGNESLASTSVDNEVTYMSPLSLAPDTVTVTEGEPGATFSVSSTLGATAPILVTSTSNAVQWATVAPGTLTIPTTAAAGDVTVTAVDDTVANGTRNTTVAATVASADPNFDGLLLDPVAVTILDNDLADPGLSTLTISPGPRVADGADAHTVTAIARNAGGQTVENALVTFTAEAGAQLSASSCVTAPEGTCAVTVASTLADSFQIDALIAGTVEPSTSPVTATFVPGPPDLTTSTIMSSALTLPVGGETSATITVTLFDANGNPVGVGGNTVEITTDAGAVSATTDNGDGTYTATLTSPVAAGTATVGYTLDAAPGERTVVINFVAGEPSASTSSIEAAPTTVAADGVATSTVTVELVDGYGNPVGTGGAAVLVNTTAGTLSGVTDHGDGTYTATLTAPSTTGTATLTFSVNGDTATAEATVDFVPGAADLATSSIQAVPTTITADGLAQSAITVTLRDSAGNPATGGGEPVTVTTTNGVIGTTLDNDDGTYTAVLTSATLPGSATVGFTLGGTPGAATGLVSFVPGAPDGGASTVAAAPGTIVADGVSTATVTVTVRDAQGNVLTDGGEAVVIQASAGAVSATTDNLDGTYTATLTSSTVAGSATVSFLLDGHFSPNTAPVAFIPGPADPAQATITASPSSVAADGLTTSLVIVTLFDSQGNAVTSGADTVDLGTTLGSFGSGTVDGGEYRAFLSSSVAGTATVSFAVDGATSPANAMVDFVAGAADPTESTISATPINVVANGVDESTVTVTVRDSGGNPVLSGTVVTMSSSVGSLSEPQDNGDGTWTAALSSVAAGASTVSFTVDGTSSANNAQVEFLPGPVDPSVSHLNVTPLSVTADGVASTTAMVTLLDEQSNAVGVGGANVNILSSLGVVDPVIDNGDGTYSATISSTTVGSAAVGFTIDGVPGTATVMVEFVPGAADPDSSTIVAVPTTVTADGVAASTLTVTLRDAQGNPVGIGGDTVLITSDLGTPSSVTDNSDGTYSATVSSTTVGSAAVGFTIDGVPGTATVMVEFVPGAADPDSSTIVAAPSLVLADGVTAATVTVTLRDAQGNPVGTGGDTVLITSDLGTPSSMTDNSDGTYTATLTSTVAGTATVGFEIDGAPGAATTAVQFTAGPADPATSTISAAPSLVLADGVTAATVTVTLRDAQGNPVGIGGDTVLITSDLGTPSAVTDNSDGTYTATLTSTVAGTATVGFEIDGAPGAATTTVVFAPGPADPATSTIEAAPPTITADGISASTVTVTLRDAQGNPVGTGGDTVTLTTDRGTVTTPVNNGDGTYAGALTSTVTGSATVGFTIDGVPGTATVMVEFVPGAADPDSSTIVAAPSLVLADGVTAATVTVTLRDAQGNPVGTGGDTVLITSDLGTPSSMTDNSDGTYTATLTSTVAGTATVGFEIDGAPGAATTAVQFTAGPADPATSTISADPATIVADGTAASTVTVLVTDAQGNPVTSGTSVVITSDLGIMAGLTDNGGGSWTATLTGTVLGTATVGFSVGGVTAAATATVELVPGSANAETSTIVAAPTVLPADGTSTATVTVALLDAQGHPVGVGGQAVTMNTDAGALSVAVDNGDGTWRATFTAPTSVSPTAATIGFTVDGVPGTATTSVSFVPGQPDGSTSLIDATPATVVADGTGTSTVTVTIRDSNGNVVPDAGPVVMITTTLGSASATTDHGDGSYTATVSSVTAGAATVGFTLSGVAQAPTAAVTFAPGPADAGTSMITATPGAIPADGIGTATVTVTLYDANGNRISVGGPVVAMGTTTGTLGTVTDNGDGSHTAVLTAPTASGTATLSFAVDGTPGAATTTVDFVRPTADVGTSEIAASPTAIGSEPGDASAVTVTLRDSNGLALGEGGDTVAIFSDLGSVGAVTDNGDGSYTASFASTAAGLATLGFTINDATAAATALVTVNDTTPPLAPVIVVPTDGAVVSPLFAASGTGEPGANLTMSTGAITLCVTAVDPAGVWSCATAVALPAGPHTLVAVQEDVADNVSPESAAVMVTVDAEPPPPPVPSPTNGLTVSGTTLPGTTVTVRTDDGALVCNATAAPDSTFACVPPAPLEDGTLLRLIATDDAGNDSSEALVRVGGARVSLELTTAQPGQTQTAFGSGFLPGEDVTGLLESAPISLGLQTADADGAVTFIIALPGDIEVGEHTVTLTGTRSGAVAATFTVVLPPKVVDPPAVAPPVDNLPPVAGPGGLAGTGLALAALPALAILLLLSGSPLLITRRRSESA